jgi:pimeloyl-ACP methyl ester carboxylesterase
MPFVKVNGAELYYEDQGVGPETMVFFHSLLFNCRMFDGQIDALRDRYRCVAFDFRGHGKSEVTRDGYDMDTLTADTIALIQELDCAPCHFLGFSTGGFVGLRLAVKRPELLQSLILVDTSADPEPEDNLAKYKLLSFITRWVGPWAVSSRVMPIMFSESFLSDPARADVRKEWRQHFVSNDRIGVTRAVTGVIFREGVFESLGDVRVPTLILVGENDIATTPDKSDRMHDCIPNSRMVTIPNSGHMSPVEEPEAVNTAINDFLGSLG